MSKKTPVISAKPIEEQEADQRELARKWEAGEIAPEVKARIEAAAPALMAALVRFMGAHQAEMENVAARSGFAGKAAKPCHCGPCDEARQAIALAEGN